MATAKQYTKDDILELVRSNPSAVQRGILALYERQGEDERTFGIAKQRNSAGFSQGTAPGGTKLARALLAGGAVDCRVSCKAVGTYRIRSGRCAAP